MMSLEEAIEHAEDIAISAIGCECAAEHRQIAAWLRELQERRKEPAIPVAWIEKYIEWLKSLDNEFAKLAAAHISVMVKKWRDEQDERTD